MNTQLALQVETGQDWLVARVRGAFDLARLMALITAIADAAKATRSRAVLIDLTEITGNPTLSDRFNIATRVAAQGFGVPIAVVGPEATLDPRKFGELVARNRGVEVKVFSQFDSAEAWLRSRLTAHS